MSRYPPQPHTGRSPGHRPHCALAKGTEWHRNTPSQDKHTPVTHTQSHMNIGFYSHPHVGGTQAQEPVPLKCPGQSHRYHRGSGTQGTRGERSLGTNNQQRRSGSVRALRQQELVPPPLTGASRMGSQLGTLPQHPKPQLGVTVEALLSP